MSEPHGAAPSTPFSPEARRSLTLATAALFAIGVIAGGGGAVWTDVLDDFGIGEGVLGVGFGIEAAAVLPILLLGGRVTSRLGPRQMLALGSGLLVVAALGFITLSGIGLFLTLFVVRGVGLSLLDLGSNTIAMEVEQHTDRHVMGFVHAGFSAGIVFGALLALAVFAAGGAHTVVYVLVAALIVPVALYAALHERGPKTARRRRVVAPQSLSLSAFRSTIVRLSGVINGLAFGVELLISQWVAAYLRSDQGSSETTGALSVVLFGATMLVGRLTNGLLTRRYAAELLLCVQSGLVAVGGLLIVASPVLGVTLAGCVIAGFGVAGIVPTVLSLAAAVADSAPGDTAGASLLGGYLGGLLIPLAAGGLSALFSLRVGVSLVPIGGLVLVAAAVMVVRELRLHAPVAMFATSQARSAP